MWNRRRQQVSLAIVFWKYSCSYECACVDVVVVDTIRRGWPRSASADEAVSVDTGSRVCDFDLGSIRRAVNAVDGVETISRMSSVPPSMTTAQHYLNQDQGRDIDSDEEGGHDADDDSEGENAYGSVDTAHDASSV